MPVTDECYIILFIHSLCVDYVLSVICLNNTQHEVNKKKNYCPKGQLF